MLSRVLVLSLCLLTTLPSTAAAASIEEEPAVYPVPEFYYELDFVMNMVFAYALPAFESEDEYNSVFAALMPQYQRWLNQQSAMFGAPTVEGNILTIPEPIMAGPPPQLPDVVLQDVVTVPEPGSAFLMALSLAMLAGGFAWRRRRIPVNAAARQSGRVASSI